MTVLDKLVYFLSLNFSQSRTYKFLKKDFREKEDPWHFETSQYEKERFTKTLNLIKKFPHRRILEVGCAEGHFTKYLCGIADDVVAIDISVEAIERAKERAPTAEFINIGIEEFPILKKQFDVVICSEMLYYIEDKKPVIEKLKKLGKNIVVSNVGFFHVLINPYFRDFKLIDRVVHAKLFEGFKFTTISAWKSD